jgi:predicted ferric reductase
LSRTAPVDQTGAVHRPARPQAAPRPAPPAQPYADEAWPGASPDEAWPEQKWPDNAWPDNAWPEQARPDNAWREQARPDNAWPGQTWPEQARPDETWPEQAWPEQARSDETWSEQSWFERTRPAEAWPEQASPAEAWPEQALPAEAWPEQALPAEAWPEGASPEEAWSDEAWPTEVVADGPAYQRPYPDQHERSTVDGASASSPPTHGRGTGWTLVLAGWSGLVVSLWLWFAETPPGSVDSMAAVLVEAGRITGMIAGYVLLIQILLMSRVGWLERRIGASEILSRHRDLGGLLVIMVLVHAALLIVGMSAYDESSIMGETWLMLSTYEDMISAFVATGLLVGVGLLAVRTVRAVLPYELWYYLHLTSYAVLLLSYGHLFASGRELAEPGFGRSFWLALYVFVLTNLAWGRLLGPIVLNLRHRLRIAEVVPEGQDMFSIYIRGRRLDRVRARAGQFFRWRFLTRGCWWQAHPFSLSAAPNDQWLRLTIKAVGSHTERLRWLEPGVRVFAEGPSGVFTADRRTRLRALLIAGGSGIAPIRALLEELPRGTIVIYRASSPEDLIFREELDWLAVRREAEVFYVIGSRDDPVPRQVMTPKGLREIVPDVQRRDVYLCGPEGLVTSAVKILKRLRVRRRQIHVDPFEF